MHGARLCKARRDVRASAIRSATRFRQKHAAGFAWHRATASSSNRPESGERTQRVPPSRRSKRKLENAKTDSDDKHWLSRKLRNVLPIFTNGAYEALRSSLLRKSLGIGWGEFEADQPFTGNAVSVDLRCSELPAAGGVQCEVGEIRARAGRIRFRLRNAARGIDVNADGDTHGSVNGVPRFLGNVRQNLVEDFTARGRRGGGLRFIRRWGSIGVQRGRGGSCGGRRPGWSGRPLGLYRRILRRGGLQGIL